MRAGLAVLLSEARRTSWGRVQLAFAMRWRLHRLFAKALMHFPISGRQMPGSHASRKKVLAGLRSYELRICLPRAVVPKLLSETS